MLANHLLGLTILVATASFATGVFVAYSLWGFRCFRVQEMETSIADSRAKAMQLRQTQSALRARHQD